MFKWICPAVIELATDIRGAGTARAGARVRCDDLAALVSGVDAAGPLGRSGGLNVHKESGRKRRRTARAAAAFWRADMNLLTLPFRLPLMPLQGVIKLGEILQEQAERELHDPASVRRQLEEAEQARASGEASDEQVAQAEHQAVGRLLSSPSMPQLGPPGRR